MGTRTVTYSHVVHLSHVIAPDMPQWPGDPPLEIATVAERSVHGYYLRRVVIGEHSATHVNAPVSFCAGGAAIHATSADALVAPAVVLDARVQAAADADYLASPDDLAAWEHVHGQVPAGSIVLLHTGWAARWSEPTAFFNLGADGCMHFPGFSPELADTLVDQRHVAGIGIDTHGVDGGRDHRFTVNTRVLHSARLVVENLAHLDRLPPTGATLMIGVLRLRDGSGSPAAVLALVP
jgi:kynurenine formamidase